MPLLALPFQEKINDGVTITTKDRVLQANFGGGYKQIVSDGLQSMPISATITLSPLTEAEKNTLRQFMIDVGVVTGFTITLPGQVAAMKVRRASNNYTEAIVTKQNNIYQFATTFDIIQHLENV